MYNAVISYSKYNSLLYKSSAEEQTDKSFNNSSGENCFPCTTLRSVREKSKTERRDGEDKAMVGGKLRKIASRIARDYSWLSVKNQGKKC